MQKSLGLVLSLPLCLRVNRFMISRLFDVAFRYVPRSWHAHREEMERVGRFLIIGGLSFLFFYGLYALVSRVIWPSGNRNLQNFLVTVTTSILNYLAHRSWTFRSRGTHATQALRYILVAISAILLQSFLFWIGYRILKANDLLVIFIVALLIPFYTYFAHKMFTFRAPTVLSSK